MKAGVRFKIFERDNFTCQYCGRKPVENEYKWKYMCGILKNLKLKRENPRLAKQMLEANRNAYKSKIQFK